MRFPGRIGGGILPEAPSPNPRARRRLSEAWMQVKLSDCGRRVARRGPARCGSQDYVVANKRRNNVMIDFAWVAVQICARLRPNPSPSCLLTTSKNYAAVCRAWASALCGRRIILHTRDVEWSTTASLARTLSRNWFKSGRNLGKAVVHVSTCSPQSGLSYSTR